MRSRIRDALLIATVGTAVIVTGSALYGLGRRLPPPPEVRPAPAPQVAALGAEFAEQEAVGHHTPPAALLRAAADGLDTLSRGPQAELA